VVSRHEPFGNPINRKKEKKTRAQNERTQQKKGGEKKREGKGEEGSVWVKEVGKNCPPVSAARTLPVELTVCAGPNKTKNGD